MESVNIDYIVIMFDTRYIDNEYAKETLMKHVPGKYDVIKDSQYPVVIKKNQGIQIQSDYIGTVDNIKNVIDEKDKKTETVEDEMTCYSYLSCGELIEKLKRKHMLII